jgi:hypothetical protein
MERFTSYLQQRENVGLDLEGTLLTLLDQVIFEPLSENSRYCLATNESSVDGNDQWYFNMDEDWPEDSVVLDDSKSGCSALLSIDLDPDQKDLHRPAGPSGPAT